MAQYELNLRDYLRILRKRKIIIILTFLLMSGSSLFFSRDSKVIYQAVTSIKIEERKTVAGLMTEWIVYSPADVMESQAKLIKGHNVLKQVALRLGKISGDSPEEKVNEVVASFEKSINTEKEGSTNIIRIIATSENQQEAIELANTIAEVYIGENLSDKNSQARTARQFIQEQLTTLEARLKDKEESLKKLLVQIKNVSMAEPIQNKLAELQFKLADLEQKYTDKHPEIIQLKEQIADLENKIKLLSDDDIMYSRLNREIETDRKLYTMLKEKLEEARITEAQKVSDVSVVNPAVTAGVVSSPNNKFLGLLIGAMLGIVVGFAFALILENLDTSIATIEDVEKIMNMPVLGVIPSVSFDLEKKTNKGLLANFKRKFFHKKNTPEEERYIHLILHYNPTSPIAESYRNINTNLKLDSSRKALLITSAGPQEGKSTIITNLGLAVAQSGAKTLLVSSDIRRPTISKVFGVKKEMGLSDVLMGTLKLEDALKSVTDIMLGNMSFEEISQTPGMDNVWLLTSGPLSFSPTKVLESKEMALLIEQLKERFDVIFFDAPPVLPVADASILAPKMDGVILVYEIGRTSRDALLRSKNQLETVGGKILGIILNQTRQEIEADVIYPYYYRYRYYKTEEPQEGEGKGKKA